MSVSTPPPYPSLMIATVAAVAAASHLTTADHAAAQALVVLAGRIDEGRASDNVSLPTFVKLCEALAMTPLSRRALLGEARPKESGGDGSGRVEGDGGEPSELERKRRELRSRLGAPA